MSLLRGRHGQLRQYHQCHQTFPLQLPLVEEQDKQTCLLGDLQKTCEENTLARRKGSNWISEESWRLIAHRAMLRDTSRLCQTGGHCLHCQIGASLCKDRVDQTARVRCAKESKLGGGNVQEAISHLKGWYRAVSEMQAKLCYHTMEHQTSERVNLYARRASPGDPFPINYDPIKIKDDAPSDKEIRLATSKLMNGQAVGGASGMHAKHIIDWLQGVRREEDAKGQGAPSNGDNRQLFAHLVQAAWTYGIIPCQLFWIIVILIPKGGGDYCGIGLLERIWKMIERIIDRRLDSIQLHDSLHSCRHQCGKGTAIIEAKLAQQLSYLELQPFYGVFLNLRKAFDAMDREQSI